MTVVRVCENPSIVEAAADAFGVRSAPLVCTFGRPSIAAWALLRGLDGGGTDLLVSADRDDAGRQIEAGMLAHLQRSSAWLAAAEGLFEEDRLKDLLDDVCPGECVK